MATKKTASNQGGKAKPKGSTSSLQGDIEEALKALPPAALQTNPTIPVNVVILEAERLLDAAAEAKAKLAKLRDFDMGQLDRLPVCVAALAEAERQWQRYRYAPKEAGSLGELRKEGEALRGAVVSACRYLLRKNPAAQAELDRIAEGEGLADLIADLDDLGVLVHEHPGLLDGAIGVPTGAVGRLAELSALLKKGNASTEGTSRQERRNGLLALVEGMVDEVRAAARYLFQNDPKRLAPFLSRYEHDRKRRQRAKKPVAEGPE